MTGPPLPPGLHYCLPFPFGRVRRVKPDEVRRVAIGSSSEPAPGTPRPQEAEILTGDTNLVDVQAVAHYRVTDPAAALFAVGATQADGQPKWDLLVRQSVEEALRAEILRRPADAALAADRSAIEAAVRNRAADTLRRYGCGLTLDAVRLGSVRPPPEVAHAFLEADCAAEDKQAKINRAETARLRVQAVFQAEALRRVAAAQAYGQARPELARGESARFLELAEAQAAAPEAARFRLRLETAEQTLAGRRKLILDRPSQGNPVP